MALIRQSVAPHLKPKRRGEADGEDVDANAEVAGDDEMSPLVNEDENTEDK